jgi:hypothetical protein
MFLRAIENSGNSNSAPILLQLVETSKDKKTGFAGGLYRTTTLIQNICIYMKKNKIKAALCRRSQI